jgi:hypothetical protein
MGIMIVRHRVTNYGQRRPIFDGHVEMQRAAGLIKPELGPGWIPYLSRSLL